MPAAIDVRDALGIRPAEAPGDDERYTLVLLGERTPRLREEFSCLEGKVVPLYDCIRTVAVIPQEVRTLEGPQTLETSLLTEVSVPFSLAVFTEGIQLDRQDGRAESPFIAIHREEGRNYVVNPARRLVLPSYADGPFPAAYASRREVDDAITAWIEYVKAYDPYIKGVNERFRERMAAGDPDAKALALAAGIYEDAAVSKAFIFESRELGRQYGVGSEVYDAHDRARDAFLDAIVMPLHRLEKDRLQPMIDEGMFPAQYRHYALSWSLGDRHDRNTGGSAGEARKA
jgi:hypothetical protein